ncbi:hypothetical protein HZA39_04450 [Candidatus Peregrinibacteria bacterium]|nr:hypothetical protein [Candidatus Peregrinibacteria bacterium]
MFFSRQRKVAKLGKRFAYGKTPVLQNRPAIFKKKKNIIENIAPEPKKLKKILIIFIAAAVTFSLIFWIFLSGAFKINEIVIDYAEFQSQNSFIKNYFDGFIGKNIIFAKIEPVAEKIRTEHPEFESLVVKKDFPHKIRIAFSEYSSIMNVVNYVGAGVYKFIINEAGFASQSNMENPNLPYVKIITDKPFEANSIIIPQDKIQYIINAEKYFEEKFKMAVLDSEYKLLARELHLRTEKYFKVMLDAQRPYEEQFLKLKKALSKIDIYNTPLEYIDLRVYSSSGEKIIFKKRK